MKERRIQVVQAGKRNPNNQDLCLFPCLKFQAAFRTRFTNRFLLFPVGPHFHIPPD